ncbi:hypothetical protein CRUP_023683 [Coryphaenoides rupestris]|nr:hypothetical protein CRUP_023683 [Coryphaenoides rupestris]
MPRAKKTAAAAVETPVRRSQRKKRTLAKATEVNEPKQKKKVAAKPKKEVEKAKPAEEPEAPAENGEAKEEAPSADEDKKEEEAE